MEPDSKYAKRQEQISGFYQVVGQNISDARKRNGFTQEIFSEMLGISRVSLINIESGKQRLPLYLISTIAELTLTKMDSLVPAFDAKPFVKKLTVAPLDKSKITLKCMDCCHEFKYTDLITLKKQKRCPECGSIHYAIDRYVKP